MGDELEQETPALENPDVKATDAPESSAEGQTDVTPAPSAEAPSMLEVAQAIVDKSEDEDESGVTPEDTTSPEGEVEPEDEDEEDASSVDPQDAKLPFAKHKRFQEVLAKAKERDVFEAKVKEQEPELKQWQYHKEFIQANGITDTEVSTVMNALALSRTNPAKARELLQPLYDSLGQLDPNILPADLQEKVKEGDITEEYARRLWKAECLNKVAAQSGQHQAVSQQQLQQKAINNTITAWESKAKLTNPDFKPSKDATKPGLYEVVRSFYTSKLAYTVGQGQPNTPMLHQQLLDASLTEAKALFNGRLAGKPTRKLPNSRMSSSQTTRKKAFSPDDEIAAVAAKYGYNFSRNGEDSE